MVTYFLKNIGRILINQNFSERIDNCKKPSNKKRLIKKKIFFYKRSDMKFYDEKNKLVKIHSEKFFTQKILKNKIF